MTTIPASDPALLAAQAKAGQAGVDAYNAAKDELTKQRQGAVDQAMRESALRGSPVGAQESISSTVTAPYDQRIASLTQAAASAGAAGGAQEDRMKAYGAAANESRSLIPGQIQLATAPIRAETDFKVAQIGAQGRADVDKITAQMRLLELQAQAAAAKASRGGGGGGGGGGGSSGKLTGTALKAKAMEGAASKYAQLKQEISGARGDEETAAKGTAASVNQSRQDAVFANAGNEYAGRAMADYMKQHPDYEPPGTQKPANNFLTRLIGNMKSGLANVAAQAAEGVRNEPIGMGPARTSQNPLGVSMMPGQYNPEGVTDTRTPRLEALNKIIGGLTGGRLNLEGGIDKNVIPSGQWSPELKATLGPNAANATRLAGAFRARLPEEAKATQTISDIAGYRQGKLDEANTSEVWRDMMAESIADLRAQGYTISEGDEANALGYDAVPDFATPEEAIGVLTGQTPKKAGDKDAADVQTLERDFATNTGYQLKPLANAGGLDEKKAYEILSSDGFTKARQDFQRFLGPGEGEESDFDGSVKSADQWLNKNVTGQYAAQVRAMLKQLELASSQTAPYGGDNG